MSTFEDDIEVIDVNNLPAWDTSEFLNTPETISAYLQLVLEEGDMKEFAAAVGKVAKAIGMTEMARRTGMKRPALYRLLDGTSNPRMDTINTVIEALGLKLTIDTAA